MLYDVAIVGGGPAGLSAAVALACEGRSVVLLEKGNSVGGQIGHSHLVENVIGYSEGFSGEEFALQAYNQAINLGVYIMLGQQVMLLDGWLGNFSLVTPQVSIPARTILLAVGVAPRPLPFTSEPDRCTVTNSPQLLDAEPGEHVVVYGGGNSAGQAAAYYAKRYCSVTLIAYRPVEETMDARWIAHLDSLGVNRVVGKIRRVDNDTVVFTSMGVVQHLTPTALHSFIGGEPTTGWLDGWVQLDDAGYIVTDSSYCTATPGVYAAGDCVSGAFKNFSCAVGRAFESKVAVSRCLQGIDAAMRGVV